MSKLSEKMLELAREADKALAATYAKIDEIALDIYL